VPRKSVRDSSKVHRPDPWDPNTSVFINCPYDDKFQELFDSILFATVACGFTPRSAIDTGTVSDSRIDRIRKAMFGSRYSIHDLSRCRGEGSESLARFNMPLELGFAMSRRFLNEDSHDWLVLVPEEHEYLKYISDLGAFDPKKHKRTKESRVPPVVNWLKTRPDAPVSPFPDEVVAHLDPYLARITELRSRSGGELPWSETILTAQKYAKRRPRRVSLL
jgi:hypothetical protein